MNMDLLTTHLRFANILVRTLIAILSFEAAAEATNSQNTSDAQQMPQFGGKYAGLTSRQKSLIDDLYRRYSAVTGSRADPENAYNGERTSWRATFEAITHALEESALTDANGSSLGDAIDLVDYVEAVHGKIKGTRGDHQYRMYVHLEPGTLETLEKSQQFSRGPDNTFFHIEYPLNYRELGTPSIQYSMVPDATRADIDVDYRSSKFPKALVDGHLTAGNSDIAAGKNLEVHNGKWDGLVGWWNSLFGLPFLDKETYKEEDSPAQDIPIYPRHGKSSIEEAVHDFLGAWLVEGESNQAVAYLSDRAYACLALEDDDPASVDYGTAPLEIVARLTAVKNVLGDVASLDDAVLGVRLSIPDFRVLHQKYHRLFVVYGVPEHVAAQHDCSNYIRVGRRRERKPKEARGFEYFATTFYVNAPSGRSETLGMLWTKEEGYWKIISYEVEPGALTASGTAPNIGPPSVAPELRREPGDPRLIAATQDFFQAWLLEKDYQKAMGYLLRRCYPCANLDTDDQLLQTPEAQLRRVHDGFRFLSDHIGAASTLDSVVEGVEPAHVHARIVTHPNERAYSLSSVSDWLGDELDCTRRVGGLFSAPDQRTQRFGRYYLTTFRIKTVAGETVPLTLAWVQQDGEWRIFSYKLESV